MLIHKSVVIALQVLLLAFFPGIQGQQSDCNTPQGTAGRCIIIRQCQPLLTILTSQQLNPEIVNLLTRFQCGFEGMNPRVCCPLVVDQNFNQFVQSQSFPSTEPPNNRETDNASVKDLLKNPLLPEECGKDLIPRIVGGHQTALNEFPWMALLEYEKPNGRSTACGGVLISKRYVLTAAHCIKGKDLPTTWRLASVRLGEYNTDTNPDCIQDGEEVICADDPITVGVEEQIVHEDYKPHSRDQRYDIALLRLSRDVKSTLYVTPICLPKSDSYGDKIYTAGWGKTENTSASNIKLKVSLPLADKQACDSTYDQVGIRLGYGQICAGGERGKDSCRGDSGGPLMAVTKHPDGSGSWTSIGVVSFGPSPCGSSGWPGVYTKVFDFVPWIVSKIRS